MVLTLLAAGAYMGISNGRRATDQDDKDTHLYYGVGSLALGIMYISQLISDRSK